MAAAGAVVAAEKAAAKVVEGAEEMVEGVEGGAETLAGKLERIDGERHLLGKNGRRIRLGAHGMVFLATCLLSIVYIVVRKVKGKEVVRGLSIMWILSSILFFGLLARSFFSGSSKQEED